MGSNLRTIRWVAFGLLALGAAACGRHTFPVSDLPVVPRVDLERYMGLWYEIAAIPKWFQEGCTGTTATYTLREDGDVDVLNECWVEGAREYAEGLAWIVDPETNARLKVEFFWPFAGDYWIIDLDPDYRWVVVGHPERTSLWILARSPEMDPWLYQEILGRIAAQGYDLGAIVRTLPPDREPAEP